ncbi:beta-1,3-N-acetylglucosaminyltransferase manic fringe [Lepeophtheirus salmonis]|nr:beta-1,3-N-acetylglucosaminyltransferase manic fringe-like [Lepeophtheirus salmonis]
MTSCEKIEISKLNLDKKTLNNNNNYIEERSKNVNIYRETAKNSIQIHHNPNVPSNTAALNNNGSENSINSRDIERCSDPIIMPRFLKSRKKIIIFLGGLGLLCFLFGLCLPFLFQMYSSSSSQGLLPSSQPTENEPNFGPLRFRSLGQSWKRSPRKLGPEAESLLRDLYISVKTTKRYHFPRLILLLETWVPLVKEQTWFFTDTDDPEMFERSGGHMVQTNCSSAHSRTALACKMGVEFDYFLKSQKRWWCHFDDDNYVHVRRLAQVLSQYPADFPQYLGKPSTAKPLEVSDPNNPDNTSHFWFATGGAGFCVTRTMVLKMAPYASGGKFIETGDKFWFPDDVTFGYIVEHLLGDRLTVVPEFHSHLESMKSIKEESLPNQISVSYINYNGVENVINIRGPFSEDIDPTRFYSLHCRLYDAIYCPKTEIR